MAPFRFRLEQVRLYRKRLEEQAMQNLSLALARRDALRRRLDSLQEEINAQLRNLSRSDLLDGAQRWLAQSWLKSLKLEKKDCAHALDEAEEQVAARREDLTGKARDRELLDTLKQKQSARHDLLERREERKQNDETATIRYRPASI
ncbi:MAG: flagellar export protein FliJ [Desulfovibrio sp.]|jgi:flagellar FliJ protein|nr:flagellar export protein FliJ [Desulfovibrio sp.]